MSDSLTSLIQSGTKLWLDSVDPSLVTSNKALGATGATSNPIIVADLIKGGCCDDLLQLLSSEGKEDTNIAWALTDHLVSQAQQQFRDIWNQSGGNDGYVSFELDPLLEDQQLDLPHDQRVAEYIKSGLDWSQDRHNRMIKVPATPAGIEALEPLAASGLYLNVTLIFTKRQYELARDSIWRGAQKRQSLTQFKSVYSIFVSRIDVYTEKHCPQLSEAAQGLVGIVNAKRIWQANQEFWRGLPCPLDQEIIFASTGTKKPSDPPWKYVQALAGSDIQTNPPATNDAVVNSGLTFSRTVDQMPPGEVLADIDACVDMQHLESTLMREGIAKFADPHKALLELIGEKRRALASAD